MHSASPHLLAIDIGNTRTKVACFVAGERRGLWQMPTAGLEAGLAEITAQLPETCLLRVGWISVADDLRLEGWACWARFLTPPVFVPIRSIGQLRVRHNYVTPDTLGIDRIVGVIAAQALAPGCPVLVVDAGTAITYDYADAEGVYQGGGISPGIRMRFQALHSFTARLPLVEMAENIPLTGNSTYSSIRSGVVHGAGAEVQGMIDRYCALAGPSLQVALTGGDILTFENQLEKVNFANPYLLLDGIHLILNQNLSP